MSQNPRRNLIKGALLGGAAGVGALTLGQKIAARAEVNRILSSGADPVFSSNGVQLPSLVADPAHLAGSLYSRSDLKQLTYDDGTNYNRMQVQGGMPFVTVTVNGGPGGDGGNYGVNTAGTVTNGIAEALAANQTVWVRDGTYNMPGGFTTIKITKLAQQLWMADAANIVVPNGFASFVFEINDSVQSMTKCKILGGSISEAGTPSNLWTGFRIYSHSANGVWYNRFQDTWLGSPTGSGSVPKIGVQLDIDSATGFINNNVFENITTYQPTTNGVLFNPTSTSHVFAGNTFIHCEQEFIGAGTSAVGWKNIDGNRNTFIGDFVDGPTGSQITANIVSTASGTVIIGGSMTSRGFTDASAAADTMIIDDNKILQSPSIFIVKPQTFGTPAFNIYGASGAHVMLYDDPNNVLANDGSGNVGIYKKVYSYNGVVTAGIGSVPVYAATSQKAETTTADANVLTLAPAAVAGNYRVNVGCTVNTATAGVVSFTISYKDSAGHTVTASLIPIFQLGTAAPALAFTTSAASRYYGVIDIDIDNSATNIVIAWVGGGVSSAKVTAIIEQLA